jgi:hypothetical protein
MPIEHIVVDGSNIATEGRSLPSLKQLEEAVAELRRDHPNAEITVIVDATFAHRIDPSEVPRFEQAALRGEYVHPPAGAIGRGDAFLLRVAEKVDATVLSNDSFQEFHGEHPWLFERGRLLGGTPVPGIGWIFSPRQPVRGPRSREAVRETVQAKKRVTKAIAVATKEVVEPAGQSSVAGSSAGRSRSRSSAGVTEPEQAADGSRQGGKRLPLAVNGPLTFISFIAGHPLGEQVEGEVEGYTSHGAVIRVGEMRCYIPLANLGDPPPRSAREVLKRHERGSFVLTALDPQRRGAELALPGIAHVSGHPREETVAAEVRLSQPPRKRADGSGAKAAKPAAKKVPEPSPPKVAATAEKPAAKKVRAASPPKVAATAGKPAAKKVRAASPPKVAATAEKPAAKNVVVPKTLPAQRKVSAVQRQAKKTAPVTPVTKKAPPANRALAAKNVAAAQGATKKAAAAKVATGKKVAQKKAPRTDKASAARQSVSSPVGASQKASVPAPANDEPRARRSPRTTANASRRGTSDSGRGRRGRG